MKLNYKYSLVFNENWIESNRIKDFSTIEEIRKELFKFKKPYQEGIGFRIGIIVEVETTGWFDSNTAQNRVTTINLIQKYYKNNYIDRFELDDEYIVRYDLDIEKVSSDFDTIYNELINL